MIGGRHLIVALLVTTGLGMTMASAQAASSSYYLGADGAPTASLSEQAPTQGGVNSVTLLPSSAGAGETDPLRYQQWQRDMSGAAASINSLTIWVAPADPDGDRPVGFGVYVMDCAGSCVVLATNSKTVQGMQTWTKMTLPVKVNSHEFQPGHALVVKVTTLASSADAVMFAFGTQDFASSLLLTSLPATTTTTTIPPTTTSSTSTTTTTPTTTTTTTTTAPPPTTTTTAPPPTTTTTAPAPTTTTTTPRGATTTTPPTTTTIPTTTTTTDQAGIAVTGPTLPPRSSIPQLIDLGSSVDTPADQTVMAENARGTSLMPTQGLAVVFSTVSETFSLYWEVAIGLGLVMSVLLLVGFSNLEMPRPIADTSERIRRIR